MKAQPVAATERIAALDLMRGFSLLGILLINMLAFHSPFSYIDPYSWFDGAWDDEVFVFLDIFVQASFYPLFSILFGYGLTMQFMKAEERRQPFAPFAAKRLAILLIIGIIHAFLIWYGDILITYAITGFLLIGMMRIPASWLLGLGAVIYAVPQFFFLALMFVAVGIDPNFYTGMQEVQNSLAAYPTGTFAEIFSQRFDDWMYSNNPVYYLELIVRILPFFMIGAAAAKWRLVERAKELTKFWRILGISTLAFGLVLKATPYLIDNNYAYSYLQDSFGGPIVAVGYASLIILAAQNARAKKLFNPIAKAGRMSLTTYLMQSVIATLIFYSYGLGLYGQVDLLTGTWIALGIFAIQLIFAEVWFSKFKQGPIEFLWRKASYGRNFEKSNNSKE
ncbi:hypothetical protein BN1080_01160 [Planococcus massiliensis]|uniref:DUF418 domain-containing protein n=1 Tax=Planococcus massiliensis TaxID=1499687 RepID=A0A098EIY4_9BACL|nr:DUF418 domain-containing protein [Planococcus massiliensis]MCJ1907004.1 DUF418 domain-containing protein [Planococcus ruber]CEG22238.1 hypothetical protein BN1080_01160 [Planococcus massiliensis]